MGSFVRRVRTGSGATAVQIVHKKGRQVVGIEHLGSAHDEKTLKGLLAAAQQRLHAGQEPLELRLPAATAGGPVVESTASLLLWDALTAVYRRLGFDTLADTAFEQLVLARVIEPVSKADTVRVLGEIGVESRARETFMRCLKRVQSRGYRARLAQACLARATRSGPLTLVLYDVTTLHFEIPTEDRLRKVGMSKEHRVDPQVTVGLLTDRGGFPLDVHLFAGNKAETTTVVPVLDQFTAAHPGLTDVVVVADAGMLSAANLTAVEDAGYRFIVGSKQTKAPYDLADHFARHGNAFRDGETIETTRAMGVGAKQRDRRVVWHYDFTRSQHDNKAINAMVAKAEQVAAGTRVLKKDRFVKITGHTKGVDWDLVDRARYLTGLKGYVTNIDPTVMDGAEIVAQYKTLYQVERSFRITKSDLAARPVFHHLNDSIEAHLTIVLAALAVARDAEQATGVSIKKILHTLRPLRSATITIGDQQLHAHPRIDTHAHDILNALNPDRGH